MRMMDAKDEVREILESWATMMNLCNDNEKVKLNIRRDSRFYIINLTRKININKSSSFLLDCNCMTIVFDDIANKLTVGLDEQNSSVLLDNHPKLEKYSYIVSRKESPKMITFTLSKKNYRAFFDDLMESFDYSLAMLN